MKRTTRIERAPPGWRPGALPSELHPRESLRQESNPHLGRTKGACYAVDTTEAWFGSVEPEGFEPSTTRRSIGFCVSNYQEPERGTLLPRAAAPGQVETAGVEPAPPRCKRGALPPELRPQVSCERVESNHHSARHRVYSAESSPVLSVRKTGAAGRIRTGTSRITTSDAAVTPQPPR
jgi:hypothetical protein